MTEPLYRLEIRFHNSTSWQSTNSGRSAPLITLAQARNARDGRKIYSPAHSFRIIEIKTGKVVE